MGHFFQGFLADLSESLALGFAQVQSSFALIAQDVVFGCEIRVSEQQFFWVLLDIARRKTP
jgi:hypothetical protein